MRFLTKIYSLFGGIISLRTSLPHQTFSAGSVRHTPLSDAFSMFLIPNEISSNLRFRELDKRGVLDILKLVPVNNFLLQSAALPLERNEILFRMIRVPESLSCVWNQTCKVGKGVDR